MAPISAATAPFEAVPQRLCRNKNNLAFPSMPTREATRMPEAVKGAREHMALQKPSCRPVGQSSKGEGGQHCLLSCYLSALCRLQETRWYPDCEDGQLREASTRPEFNRDLRVHSPQLTTYHVTGPYPETEPPPWSLGPWTMHRLLYVY